MDKIKRLQYQALAPAPPQSIQPGPTYESPWHQPWSEPVRQKIRPALAVALIASGLFQTLGPPANTAWHQAFSEPVRLKRGLGAQYQQFDPYQVPVQPVVSRFIQWFANLSEPVRLKRGIPSTEQAFLFFEPEPPIAMSIPWYGWLSEPVRQRIGLRAWLQHFWEGPPRWLPTPNVTVTLAATEINNDVALIGISVYNPVTPSAIGTSANVSIHEVKVEDDAAASLRES